MATRVRSNKSGISIVHNYASLNLGTLLIIFAVTTVVFLDRSIGVTAKCIVGGLGLLLWAAFVGTRQILRYDRASDELSYESSVFFLAACRMKYKASDIREIHYRQLVTTHHVKGETWDTSEGTVDLYFGSGRAVKLLSISHSELFESGLKQIAAEIGVPLERNIERSNSRRT